MKTLALALAAVGAGIILVSSSVTTDASVVVSNTNDSGTNSLRDAIANAVDGDTITFSLPSGSVISLTSGELAIGKNLTINGPGAKQLTVQRSTLDGQADARVFSVSPATSTSPSPV